MLALLQLYGPAEATLIAMSECIIMMREPVLPVPLTAFNVPFPSQTDAFLWAMK